MRQTIPVTAPMPLDLEYRARLAAATQRISRAELVRRAVVDYLERLEQTTPTGNPIQDETHREG